MRRSVVLHKFTTDISENTCCLYFRISSGNGFFFRNVLSYNPRHLVSIIKRSVRVSICGRNNSSGNNERGLKRWRYILNEYGMCSTKCNQNLSNGLRSIPICETLQTPRLPLTFTLIFLTATQTCHCSEQKLFTQPDDCAALYQVFRNMHNKIIYNEN
jgi:hypothetical protein